jgi:LPXTG-motif cell wall-anchored protein
MNLHFSNQSQKARALVCGVTLGVSLFCLSARADEWNKKTVMTMSEPVQVQDVVLQPGKYVFKLQNSQTDRHIVEIFNADESRVIDTVLAIPKIRLRPTGHVVLTYWETPSGTAKALRDWFFPGDLIGQEFPYPKNPRQIAKAAAVVMTAAVQPTEQNTAVAPPQTETQPMTESQPVAEPQTQAEATPPQQPQEQTPTAAPPAETQPAPMPENSTANSELPKTASPYPLFGLSGISLAAIGLLLRRKRLA